MCEPQQVDFSAPIGAQILHKNIINEFVTWQINKSVCGKNRFAVFFWRCTTPIPLAAFSLMRIDLWDHDTQELAARIRDSHIGLNRFAQHTMNTVWQNIYS